MPSKLYLPDDARFEVAALDFLHSDAGGRLRAEVARLAKPEHPTVAEIARLRKEYPAGAVGVALTLAAVQAKGRAKFPELRFVWSPPEALEQATSSRVGRHKAGRFAAAIAKGTGPIFDLCCGIGGDAMALADVAPLTGVDLSAVRMACLRYNVAECAVVPRFGVKARVADVEGVIASLPGNALVHIDPARRSGGKRSPEYADMRPGPEVLEVLLRRAAGVAIKLSPAVDFDTLPAGHLELISEDGSVVQAVLWTGQLAFVGAAERTATILSGDGGSWTFTATPSAAAMGSLPVLSAASPQQPLCLYELDGALTCAGLAGPFCAEHSLMPLTVDGGYALASRADFTAPCVTAFSVLAICPYSERLVAEALQGLPAEGSASNVEVKTRGRLAGVDTDRLQVAWSRAVRGRCTVLVFRHEKDIFAVIARRV